MQKNETGFFKHSTGSTQLIFTIQSFPKSWVLLQNMFLKLFQENLQVLRYFHKCLTQNFRKLQKL